MAKYRMIQCKATQNHKLPRQMKREQLTPRAMTAAQFQREVGLLGDGSLERMWKRISAVHTRKLDKAQVGIMREEVLKRREHRWLELCAVSLGGVE